MTLESLARELRVIEMELRMQGTRARMQDLQAKTGIYPYREEPSPMSDALRSYSVAPDLRLVQFKNTVRNIRGCPKAARLDTTTFVLFGTDSAKRVTPERTFGQAMPISILGAMRSALTRESLSSRAPAPVADLPRAPKACG